MRPARFSPLDRFRYLVEHLPEISVHWAHARPRTLAAFQNIAFAEFQWIEVELLRQNVDLALSRPDGLRGADGSKTSRGDCISVERMGFHAEIWKAVRANDSIRSFFRDAGAD